MSSINNICIVGVYYGKFNNYFPLWLKSCAHNPTIDFLVVTDIQYEAALPYNVHFLRLSLENVRELASSKTRVVIPSLSPKKLCDLKPMYGLIFEDYLSKYEYWGECDFDLIWGDIRYFLEKFEYFKFDKFLPLGHLSLYRNTNDVNRYFMLDGDSMGGYVAVLKNKDNTIFDEVLGINKIIEKNKKKSFFYWIFADITRLHKRFMLSSGIKPDGTLQINYKEQIFYWSNGKVFRDFFSEGQLHSEEFMYIHYSGRENFCVNQTLIDSNSFFVTYDGFIPKNGETTGLDIKNLNRYVFWKEKIDDLRYFYFRVLNKLGFKIKWRIK